MKPISKPYVWTSEFNPPKTSGKSDIKTKSKKKRPNARLAQPDKRDFSKPSRLSTPRLSARLGNDLQRCLALDYHKMLKIK